MKDQGGAIPLFLFASNTYIRDGRILQRFTFNAVNLKLMDVMLREYGVIPLSGH